MDTFIIVVMLCTFNVEFNQEICTPMVQNPKIYYQSEDKCNIAARSKRKEIGSIARKSGFIVTGVYSTCIKEGSNS